MSFVDLMDLVKFILIWLTVVVFIVGIIFLFFIGAGDQSKDQR